MEISTDIESVALSRVDFAVLYPSLRRFAAFVGDSDTDPDDLVQEALSAYLRRFAGTIGADNPVAYLRVAIVGLVGNHRRAAERRQKQGPLTADVSALDAYPSDLAGLLDAVGHVDRALLAAVDVEGEPIADAAQSLGLTATAARARLSRARRRIRRRLEEDSK